MKTRFDSFLRMPEITAWIIAFLFLVFNVHAVTHVVQFGGSLGFNYSPKTLNVAVGDTIKWQGDFGMHPLSSTSVPSGAASFHNGSGSSFSYAVAMAGTYQYHCDFHFGSGMTGSFTAIATGVEMKKISLPSDGFQLEQNYPNPFNSRTVIRFNLPAPQRVELTVYSILGERVAILIDGDMPAGGFAVPFDGGALASGIYYYRLITEMNSDTKRFIFSK